MGQKIGKAAYPVSVVPFCGLSRRSIGNIWQVFNDIASGFGISLDECAEICADLFAEINVSRDSIRDMSIELFKLLDTDANDLIDALEFIGTLAVISGMRQGEIVEFLLKMYDFDGKLMLSLDELTLCLRSIAVGLCKISGAKDFPREDMVEELTTKLFFDECPTFTDMTRVKISTLKDKLCIHPDICSWYAHFGNPAVQVAMLQRRILEVPYNGGPSKIENDKDEIAWRSSVALLTPMKYSNLPPSDLMPNASIELHWVYGYQSENCLDNVLYNSDGNIVYNISRYIVVYNAGANSQHIFTGHDAEVSAIAMHPQRELLASGEMGVRPKFIIWNTKSFEIAFCENIPSGDSISRIVFSDDGRLVGVMAHSKETGHIDAFVLHLESQNFIFSTSLSHLPCYAISFLSDSSVVLGGDGFLNFYCPTPEGYLFRAGIFSRYTSSQTITCLGQSRLTADTIISGTESGLLMLWTDRNCLRHVKAHDGSVTCIFSGPHGLLSGGKDFRIRLWTHSLDPGATFDISSFGPKPELRALCLSSDGTSIVLGTLGATIFEISAIDGSDLRGGAMTNGHVGGIIHSLTCHPSKMEVVTVGQDGNVFIWDCQSKLLLRQAQFEAPITAVAYNPLGDILVLGLGGVAHQSSTAGTYVCLNEEDLTKVHEAKDSTFPISIVKYSPDGETLAVGCSDGSIYLYAVPDEYELIGRCIRHQSKVIHIDFSVDNEWLRSNSDNGELFFFNTDDASFQSNISSLRDVEWSSFTCTYSWHSKEVHSSLFPQEFITSLHTPSSQSEVQVASTNLGWIRLHPFPCPHETLPCQRYPAHVGSIPAVRFSFEGSLLFTCGASDASMLQWNLLPFKALPEAAIEEDVESEDFALEANRPADIELEIMPSSIEYIDNLITKDLSNEVTLTPECDVWHDIVVPPNHIPNPLKDMPSLTLRLEYVHGIRSQDLRNMVAYNKAGDVVFVASTLGVVMNRKNRSQTFFQGHTDRITCMSSSRDGSIIASGQMGQHPWVHVWSSDTCLSLASLSISSCKCISTLVLSASGQYLAIAFLDDYNCISIYHWPTRSLLSHFQTGRRRLLSLCFSEDANSLCVCGIKDITIWNQVQSKQPTFRKPEFGDIGHLQVFVCVQVFGNKYTVGTTDGYLYFFNATSLTHAVKAHNAKVYALDVAPSGKLLASGGKDGVIRLWNKKLECMKEISVESLLTSQDPRVRSVKFNVNDANLLVCTRGAEVFEVSITSQSLVGGKTLLLSHGQRELWGLATHPTKEEYITGGDDGTLRLWDALNCSLIRTIKMDTPCRCACYSSDGKWIALGFGSGKRVKGKALPKEGCFIVLSSTDLSIVHEGKDSNESIRAIRYNPAVSLLAVGSDDSNIVVYNVKDEYSKRATVQCHKAPIRSIDFSMDGQYLMSIDATSRVKYSDTSSGLEVPNPAVFRDEKWSTWSSPVGWQVQGFWMNRMDVSESILCAQRSFSKQLMVIGTSNGRIAVSHAPCFSKAAAVQARGHCGDVSNLSWLAGDSKIISIGTKDHAIFQWRVEYDAAGESGDEGGMSCDDSYVEKDAGHDGMVHPSLKKKKTTDVPAVVGTSTTKSKNVKTEEFEDIVSRKKASNVNSTTEQSEEEDKQPWKGSICPPSNFKDVVPPAVRCLPEFEWAQGARLGDSRQTIHYNYDGDIIWACGSLGVVVNRSTYQFKAYSGHTQAILSLTVDNEGRWVASGELGNMPELHIWDSRTLATIKIIKNSHQYGITCLKFSPNSEYLVSLGQDVLNGIVVYRSASKHWHDALVAYASPMCIQRLLWITFLPSHDFPVCVGGKKVLYFVRSSAKSVERIRGIFGKKFRIQPLLCAEESHVNNQVLTGTVTGHIYIWDGTRVSKAITAHEGSLNTLVKVWFGYLSGGKEGVVKVWNKDLKLLHSYNIQTFVPQPYFPSCHSLRINRKGTKALVGMRSGEIFEVSLLTHSSILLSEGHSRRQIHALDTNPRENDEFITGGDDGILRIWSIAQHKCIRRVAVECAVRCLAWAPHRPLIMIGVGGDPSQAMKEGAIMALNAQSLEVIFEDRKAKKFIQDIKFSKSGNLFACSSMDGKVYVHDSESYLVVKIIEIPTRSAPMLCSDFSVNGDYLRFSTRDDELYFYSLTNKEIITSPSLVRDVVWHSYDCPFSWNSQGIWTPKGSAVRCSTRCETLNLLAVSYDDGTIKIFNYPCLNNEEPFVVIPGVATISGRLRFTKTGSHLVILDSYNRSILVYKLSVK